MKNWPWKVILITAAVVIILTLAFSSFIPGAIKKVAAMLPFSDARRAAKSAAPAAA